MRRLRPGLYLVILAQFILEMCVADRNYKINKTPIVVFKVL